MNGDRVPASDDGDGVQSAVSRRRALQAGGLGLLGMTLPRLSPGATQAGNKPKPVAAITTVWYSTSHADVLIGKILEGYDHAGGPGPQLSVPAMFLDQVHTNDIGVAKAKKYNVTLAKTIEECITLGTGSVAVDGVLIIGELGSYPRNTKGQTLYPRPRMFEDVVATFRKYDKVVPVFNDKHLAYNWHNAKWIYDTAVAMRIPFMAGSSLPVFWRDPPLWLPMGCEIEEAMAIGYSDLDSYGFHTMEALQCQLERRKGGETGVKSVQTLMGDEVWEAEKQGKWSRELYDAIMATFPAESQGRPEDKLGQGEFVLLQYCDGTKATIANLGKNNEWGIAAKLKGHAKPLACRYYGLYHEGLPVFANQLRAIERMILTGKPSYPVERTLLTTGIIDAALTSRFEFHRRQETPHLSDIRYEAEEYPFPMGQPRRGG